MENVPSMEVSQPMHPCGSCPLLLASPFGRSPLIGSVPSGQVSQAGVPANVPLWELSLTVSSPFWRCPLMGSVPSRQVSWPMSPCGSYPLTDGIPF